MEPLMLREQRNVPFFAYQGWHGLHVGFSSRAGGVGQAPYQSLNVALHVGDDSSHVQANRALLAQALDIPLPSWTCAEQVHGDRVVVVEREHIGAGLHELGTALQGADGMVTNERGVWLTSFYADCVPLYFYDPVNQIIALAHAGWRGTVANIVATTLTTMQSRYGCDVRDVRALIGPSIGACCYEVDEHVQQQVQRVLGYKESVGDVCYPSAEGTLGKYKLDLKRCNQTLMMEAGILSHHIEMSQWCTCCRTDLFFSHRGEHGKTGRMVAWLYMSDSL